MTSGADARPFRSTATGQRLPLLQYGQDVSRRVLEPGDHQPTVAEDALGVLLAIWHVVVLEDHTNRRELVDRLLDVGHREVEDRVGRRGVALPLRVDKDVATAVEAEEQGARLGAVDDLESERLGVERLRLRDVVDGEA